MISGVLTLASRSLRSVMTPRTDISWVDCERSREVRAQLLDTPHSLFPVCRDSVDGSSAWYAPGSAGGVGAR